MVFKKLANPAQLGAPATLLTGFCALLLGLILGVLPPTTAVAAPAAPAPALMLMSLDGVNFTEKLPRGLFDGSGLLVPRQSVSANLWIKNVASTPATLQVSIQRVTATTSEFAEGIDVTASDDRTPGVRSLGTLASFQDCTVVTSVSALATGAQVKSVITLTMADMTGTAGQSQASSMDLANNAGDSAVPLVGPSLCRAGISPAEPDGTALPAIAFTGGGPSLTLIVVSAVLFGAGFVLLSIRRRSRNRITRNGVAVQPAGMRP